MFEIINLLYIILERVTIVVMNVGDSCLVTVVIVVCLGTAILKSKETVKPGMWMTIVAERSQQDGSLSINGGVAVKGTGPPSIDRQQVQLVLHPSLAVQTCARSNYVGSNSGQIILMPDPIHVRSDSLNRRDHLMVMQVREPYMAHPQFNTIGVRPLMRSTPYKDQAYGSSRPCKEPFQRLHRLNQCHADMAV